MVKPEDSYLIGIFPEYNFRFLLTDCTNSVTEAIKRNSLENSSALLVAKTMLGSFFLAGMVKEEMIVNIQLEGEGAIERVMAYSDRIGRMRGTAKHNHIQCSNDDPTLGIGKGVFRVTRWGGVQKLHQSLTRMEYFAFEDNLLNYINESDQLVSFVSLDIKPRMPGYRAKGMILQALPYTEQYQIDGVLDRLSLIDQTTDELFTGSCDEILKKIETALNSPSKVLESGIPEFYCGCSIEKIKQVVVSLGPEEAFGIIDEIGYIEFICEFCKEKYLLDAEEVRLLFL